MPLWLRIIGMIWGLSWLWLSWLILDDSLLGPIERDPGEDDAP